MPTFWSEVARGGRRARLRRLGSWVLAAAVHALALGGLLWVLAENHIGAAAVLFSAPPSRPPVPIVLPPPRSSNQAGPRAPAPPPRRRPAPRLAGRTGIPVPGDALRWPTPLAETGVGGEDEVDLEPGRLGPAYERGHLWIPPLPFSPDEVAERLGLSHVEKVDSAVNAIVQAYLDSLAVDSSLSPVRPPSWVGQVGGLDFGVDSKFIYLAGLKIPTLILGLLPLPAGDFDREKRYQQLMEMRRDIYYSAWRAETLEEFKDNVRKLRERTERERELRRAQRIPPGLSPDSAADGTADP